MSEDVQHLTYEYPDDLARYMNETTYRALESAVKDNLAPGTLILDFGCGRGEMMQRLQALGYRVLGCDLDPVCVEISGAYGDTKCLAIDDLDPASFDAEIDGIVCSHVLEHLENPVAAMEKFLSISKGPVIISVPNPYSPLPFCSGAFRRNVRTVNTGHLYTWDWAHFLTMTRYRLKADVTGWYHDAVFLPLAAPIRRFLLKIGILRFVEETVLRWLLPRFSRSITAVVYRPQSGSDGS